jgi:hypothetical protein
VLRASVAACDNKGEVTFLTKTIKHDEEVMRHLVLTSLFTVELIKCKILKRQRTLLQCSLLLLDSLEIVVAPTPVMLMLMEFLPPDLTTSFSNAATGNTLSITSFHAAA